MAADERGNLNGGILVTAKDTAVVAFATLGIASQFALLLFFAAHRWRPRLAEQYGWIAYAVAVLGLPLAAWLLLSGSGWRLYMGPLLLGTWAVLGAYVDSLRRVQWRDPIRWSVFVPYVALYFWAQMFMWWPLWDLSRVAWSCFLVLFVISTALNLRGHFGDAAAS